MEEEQFTRFQIKRSEVIEDISHPSIFWPISIDLLQHQIRKTSNARKKCLQWTLTFIQLHFQTVRFFFFFFSSHQRHFICHFCTWGLSGIWKKARTVKLSWLYNVRIPSRRLKRYSGSEDTKKWKISVVNFLNFSCKLILGCAAELSCHCSIFTLKIVHICWRLKAVQLQDSLLPEPCLCNVCRMWFCRVLLRKKKKRKIFIENTPGEIQHIFLFSLFLFRFYL